jgi:hypothetical protein
VPREAFACRLLRAEWTILNRPEPVVVHRAWRSIAERAALKRAYGIGQGGFYAQYLLRTDPFIAGRATADAFAAARAAEARGHLAYFFGLFVGMARMTVAVTHGATAENP